MAIPVQYISETVFAAAGNVVPYYGYGQRAKCLQGIHGNAEVTIVSVVYDEGELRTRVTVAGGTLYPSLYEISLGDTYCDPAADSTNVAEHTHRSRGTAGEIPAAGVSQDQVDNLQTIDIPQTGDAHKFTVVAPTESAGYLLAALAGVTNRTTIEWSLDGKTVTVSIPQDIHTGASPTFTGLTLSGLTGILEAKAATAVGIVTANGSLKILRRNADNTAYEFALVNLSELGDTIFTNLEAGAILYRNASGKWVNLAKGNDGDWLTLSAGLPAWVTPTLKHLSDVADAVTDSGVAGDILVRGASAYDRLAKGPDGKALIIDPSTHLPGYGLPTMKLADLTDGYGEVFTLTNLCS